MACGRENAAAVDTENDRSLCTFETNVDIPPQESQTASAGAVTTSLRRWEKETTSSTPASQARHPARHLTNSAHSCGPNMRARSVQVARAWPLTSRRGLLFICDSVNAGSVSQEK